MDPVGLFIPCYVDQLYPQVGLATVRVLERHGVTVEYPEDQTCCGQPMANSGCTDGRGARWRVIPATSSRGYDYVVAPSGSCVSMVRNHYDDVLAGEPRVERSTGRDLRALRVPGRRPRASAASRGSSRTRSGCTRAATACASCGSAAGSERMIGAVQQGARAAQRRWRGIELVELARTDECCGFGGTFAVDEEAVSCMMGRDRVADHERAGAEVITARRHVVPDAPRRPDRGRGRCGSCTWPRCMARSAEPRSSRPAAGASAQGRGHPEAAAALRRRRRAGALARQALWWVRKKRDVAAGAVPDWEALRDAGRAHQGAHALAPRRLPRGVRAQAPSPTAPRCTGARDAAEHNADRPSASSPSAASRRLVKSKSMLTEECHLNPYLESARHRGHRHRPRRAHRAAPRTSRRATSCCPAIHMKKEEIGELFHEQLGTDRGRDRSEVPDRGGAPAPAPEVPGGRGRADRRELRRRRDRRRRRLHQRGQRRPGRLAAAACTSPAWGSRS